MAEKPALAPLLSLSIPKHPDLALVRELLDPTGRNIALWPKAKWIERASKQLVNPYRVKVTAVPDRDHKLIDAAVQIRNCVAHRSRAAAVAMNDALVKLSGGDAVLRRGARRVGPAGIGHYLFALASGERRVQTYHLRLGEIAETLRVRRNWSRYRSSSS
jgi:hypothetical protein